MGAMSATRRWSRRKALSLVLVGFLVLSSSCALVARAEDEDYEEGGSGDGYVSPQKDSGDFAGDLADAIEQQEFREEADKEVVSHIVDVAPEADLANGDGDVSTTHNLCRPMASTSSYSRSARARARRARPRTPSTPLHRPL